jgi:hypothetical protein
MEPKDCSAAQREFVFAKSRETSAGLVEKLLRLRSRVPDAVVEEWIAVGTVRAKEKITAKPQQVVDWTFTERARR